MIKTIRGFFSGKKVFVILLFLGISALSLIAYLRADPGFLINNIIPELIGVCIELLIIIFIFNEWQKKEEKNNNIKVERRLREFLIFFLRDNFKDLPPSCQPGNFYGKNHTQNQECISNLITYIKTSTLEEELFLKVKIYCKNEKEIFNNLIPVASQLTNKHFKSWVRIAYFMNKISSEFEGESINADVIKILENIKRFDDKSFESGLYVGAK